MTLNEIIFKQSDVTGGLAGQEETIDCKTASNPYYFAEHPTSTLTQLVVTCRPLLTQTSYPYKSDDKMARLEWLDVDDNILKGCVQVRYKAS